MQNDPCWIVQFYRLKSLLLALDVGGHGLSLSQTPPSQACLVSGPQLRFMASSHLPAGHCVLGMKWLDLGTSCIAQHALGRGEVVLHQACFLLVQGSEVVPPWHAKYLFSHGA